jgi:hypothetical protein
LSSGLEIMLEKYEVKDDISMLKFLSDKIWIRNYMISKVSIIY